MVRPLLLKSVRVERSRDTHRPSACREASRLRSMRTEQWIRNHSKANLRLDMPFVQAEHAVHLRRQPLVMRRHQRRRRSEEHTSELQSLMRISYAVFCLKKKKLHTLY